jgi:N-acetylglutamate synthase-like GNAT family acetyltransferase
MHIVDVTTDKGALCAGILASLPTWFGIPESNAAYERDVETLPMFGAVENGAVIGFLALKRHTPHAFEIHVMGVRPERHRSGAGRALVEAAGAHARGAGARFLTVKTRSPSAPDPNYAKTLAFYESVDFLPIEEFPLLWNPENPALMMIRTL